MKRCSSGRIIVGGDVCVCMHASLCLWGMPGRGPDLSIASGLGWLAGDAMWAAIMWVLVSYVTIGPLDDWSCSVLRLSVDVLRKSHPMLCGDGRTQLWA